MMYSPSKEERIIRILKSGRNYIHINKEGGREGVEKTVSIQQGGWYIIPDTPLLAIGQLVAAMATQFLRTILLEGGTVCPC